MTRLLKFSAIYLLLTVLALETRGQCTADAGPDKVICQGWNSMDTITIGGSPTVEGGNPPYTYSWETSYTIGDSFTYTASDYLNDTTLANPLIINWRRPDELIFNLKVKDDLGKTCTDSVRIRYSKFGRTAEDKQRTISPGDSVQLYPGVGGGIPPLTYQWTPDYNLSEANSPDPWASPDTTTKYRVTVTDSAGCQVTDPDIFEVYVNSTGNEYNYGYKTNIDIFPNPTSKAFQINGLKASDSYQYQLYNTLGQLAKSGNLQRRKPRISLEGLSKGVYQLFLTNENSGAVKSTKVVKQ